MGEILGHPVEEVSRKATQTVDESASLRAAAHELWVAGVGAVVIAREGRPVGILSERDIVARIAQGADVDTVTAGEAMTPQMIVAHPTDRVLEAAVDMLDHEIRHLPVIDAADRLVGMVSIRDLLRPMLLDALEARATPG